MTKQEYEEIAEEIVEKIRRYAGHGENQKYFIAKYLFEKLGPIVVWECPNCGEIHRCKND